MRAWVLSSLFALLFAPAIIAAPTPQVPLTYLSPRPGAEHTSALTTIVVRADAPIAPTSVSDELFSVMGNRSGAHPGHATLARDGRSVVFTPDTPFQPGEQVTVTLNEGLRTTAGSVVAATNFSFGVSTKPLDEYATAYDSAAIYAEEAPAALQAADPGVRTFLTVPDTLPLISVLLEARPGTAPGYLFVAPVSLVASNSMPSLLIVDNTGDLIYYKRFPAGSRPFDFKVQPNGMLSYFDPGEGGFVLLDSSYEPIRTIKAGNGYPTDFHDLQLLPNGNALLIIYFQRPQDLSSIGGRADAQVIDTIFQEVDPDGNVVFEWNSKDYFQITDTYQPINAAVVDYAHGNAIELDHDGNWLVSNRHISEITKINRQTGDIIWRLGGKNNQFTVTGDLFHYQHDIRRLPNGNITLFDNRTNLGPVYSRAVEYALDETNKVATLISQYRNNPDVYSYATANHQRLPNGNSLIGWGTSYPTLTEISPSGEKLFEMTLMPWHFSYRAFRLPWTGTPKTNPVAVARSENGATAVYVSWNGATEVAAYRIEAGATPTDLEPVATQERTGFETRAEVHGLAGDACFLRAIALDDQGTVLGQSEVFYSGDAACPNGITLTPSAAAQKSFDAGSGGARSTVTLEAPTGTVSETHTLIFSELGDEATPDAGYAQGLSFSLSAYKGTVTAPDLQLTEPMTLTIDYSQAALDGLDERFVQLVGRDDATEAWSSAGITLISRDTANNRLIYQVARLGQLSLAAPTPTFLPLLNR